MDVETENSDQLDAGQHVNGDTKSNVWKAYTHVRKHNVEQLRSYIARRGKGSQYWIAGLNHFTVDGNVTSTTINSKILKFRKFYQICKYLSSELFLYSIVSVWIEMILIH